MRVTTDVSRIVLSALASLWVGTAVLADSGTSKDPIEDFERRVERVRMRDGVRLYTEIYIPKQRSAALPVLLWRSPYGVSSVSGAPRGSSVFATGLRELAEDGYIFVFQDIRGRHESEGEFVLLRPPRDRKQRGAVDEGTDAYDTIDWLLRELDSDNGRVGMLGVSYPAWLSAVAAIDPHPALKAVSPQAAPADLYLTDDFFHNGAFRLSYAFEYVGLVQGGRPFAFDMHDTFAWYLHEGGLHDVKARHLAGATTMWDDFVAHPTYDDYWRSRSLLPQLGRARVPTLLVGGWFDAENGTGPLKIYEAWRQQDPDNLVQLVMGPWSHGGWLGDGRKLSQLDFGSDTAAHFRREILAPWFTHHLKGRAGSSLARRTLFETGANEWRSIDERRVTRTRQLYFHAGGRLSFDPPAASAAAGVDTYISDPAKPVPYRPRPIEPMFAGPGWSQWQAQDQRFADTRPDVLTWVSEPLSEDLVVSGRITAKLFAATTGTDSDWVVKLIDVAPDLDAEDSAMSGFQMLVSGEILRARYRDGFETPRALTPGRVEAYSIDMHQRQHRFRRGHRIMVQVQSSWFPLFDRNPQTFVDNIFLATDADFRVANQSVYRSVAMLSHVAIEVEE